MIKISAMFDILWLIHDKVKIECLHCKRESKVLDLVFEESSSSIRCPFCAWDLTV